MRSLVLISFLVLALALLRAVGDREVGDDATAMCSVRLSLVDATTGEPLAGLVRIVDAQQNRISPENLLNRGRGLDPELPIHGWLVLIRPTTIELPRGDFAFTACSGLETEFTERTINLAGRDQAELKIPLTRFYNARQAGYQNANTHVHLRKLSRDQSDHYLVDVGTADGLDIVFVSYLERVGDDLEYTTNKYSREELHGLSTDHVHFGHGEEHRHNFISYGEGYGHVMLLEIPKLIHPVSIGPGIMKTGTDGIPLRHGIDEARRTGGKVIWCHNAWGLEDIPNWLAGRLHANNIFDGGTHGSYRHSFYRYLNAGIKVPFSTGTDWFIYDFSRVYVPTDGPITVDTWLDVLASGRSYITNGPLLEFTVAGKGLGQDVKLSEAGKVSVRGRAVGRIDFERIELIQNGKVIQSAKSRTTNGHYTAELDLELPIDEPCWLALRTPPPSVPRDAEFQRPTPLNEFGRELFSHTSATFVDVDGRRIFDRAAADDLLKDMQAGRKLVNEKGLFRDEAERHRVLSVYDEGIAEMRERLNF